MIFLGLAANYSAGGALRHLVTVGSEAASEALRQHLASKYSTDDCQVEPNQAALYHNGRTALSVAVRTLVPRGGEVIVNGFTCQAVVQAVKAAKCKPVYADINAESLHFNAATLRQCLRRHPNARALIVQNTLGHPVNVAELEAIARAHQLIIIEDLAHGVSQHYPDGRLVGTVGAATVLSFGKGKVIDTISGGALVLRRAEKLPAQPIERAPFGDQLRDRIYPVFGLLTRGLYHVAGIGKYFMSFLVKTHQVQRSADAEVDPQVRLPHWQAKLALTQLQMLELTDDVAELPLRRFYLVEDREELLDRLERAKCYLREIWYDVPIAPRRYYARQKFPEAECPVATAVAAQIINLPCYYRAEQLKPAVAIIKGEDPRAEERARRAAKMAAKAAKMEAKAEQIKAGEAAPKPKASKGKTVKTEIESAAKEGENAPEPKKSRKNRHDRANAKIAAAKAAEEGGFEAGFRTTDLDFLELVEADSASLLVRKISNKTKAAPKTSISQKKPAPAPAKPKQVVKPEVPGITRANAVLKSKPQAKPKINARKNEFFEQKRGQK